jgi:undecaprenyl-diphosphatase
MRYLTHLGGAGFTVLVPVLLIVAGGAERGVGLAALAANGISNVAVQILKRVVARPRPCDAFGRPLALVRLPDPFSFPSGHASASTALAVTLTAAHPWLGPVLVPLALLVAASRVTLRVHHPSDVVAGVLLGLAGAAAALTLVG